MPHIFTGVLSRQFLSRQLYYLFVRASPRRFVSSGRPVLFIGGLRSRSRSRSYNLWNLRPSRFIKSDLSCASVTPAGILLRRLRPVNGCCCLRSDCYSHGYRVWFKVKGRDQSLRAGGRLGRISLKKGKRRGRSFPFFHWIQPTAGSSARSRLKKLARNIYYARKNSGLNVLFFCGLPALQKNGTFRCLSGQNRWSDFVY